MGRLIDTDELIANVASIVDLRTLSTKTIGEAIAKTPTVDAVPVVRCKDCKHYQFADNRAFGFPVKRCEWTGFEDVDGEDFCSRGERKDGKDGQTD